MKKSLRIIIGILSAALLFSCRKPYETSIELGVNNEEIILPSAYSGHCYVTIFSNGDWDIEIEPPVNWASLDVTGGSGIGYVRMDYKDNPSDVSRNMDIVVNGSGKTCRIYVTQPGI